LQNIAEEIETMKQNAEMRFDPLMEASTIRNDFVLLQDRLKAWENALDPLMWIGKYIISSVPSSPGANVIYSRITQDRLRSVQEQAA
jgi:hypothetical protein